MSDRAAVVTEQPRAHLELLGEGPPLLFLHGWGSSGELMMPVARPFAATHRVITPDLPGFGATDPPPRAWAVDDYVDWTVALLDRLEVQRADIIAHSHGARIALKLAVRDPSRVGKLVLAGAAGVRTSPTVGQRARQRVFKMGRGLASSGATPSPLRRRLQTWVEAQGSADYRAARGVMRPTLVKVVNEDLQPIFAGISAPTLLVWGDADTETPLAMGRLMEEQIPDAGLVVLEGAGHFAYAEQPQRFCHIVATFLGGAP